jgi:phage repressor protein C with HTH and peptisase S24 domain
MRRLGLLLGAALGFVVTARSAAPATERFMRSWPARIAVSGHSMAPTLHDGDWLLVDPAQVVVGPGDLVVARDSRATGRLIVKRVEVMGTDRSLVLTSDHPAHAGEQIGPIPADDLVGVVWLRYWPPGRFGRI